MERLDRAARRGKLAGFERGSGAVLFSASAFGSPFDGVVEARHDAVRGILSFRWRVRPMMPWLFVLLTVVTIWPGVWLTDSLLVTYFSWYRIPTWWWYVPLSVLPLPWVARAAVQRTRASIDASARERVADIARELGIESAGS
ncbi:MAG: hypothetical protein JNM07_00335 [Phycisphaerae bacterium]|nr:hypothetical protein [Phycisphaerae bacterium]